MRPDLRQHLGTKTSTVPDLRTKLQSSKVADLRTQLNNKPDSLFQESLEIQAGVTIPPLRYRPKLLQLNLGERKTWSEAEIKRVASSNPPEEDDHQKYNFVRLVYPEETPTSEEWTRVINYNQGANKWTGELKIQLDNKDYQLPEVLRPRNIYKEINPHYAADIGFFVQNPELPTTYLPPDRTTEEHLDFLPRRYKHHKAIDYPGSAQPEASSIPECPTPNPLNNLPPVSSAQTEPISSNQSAPLSLDRPRSETVPTHSKYVAWATRRGFPPPAKKPEEIQLPKKVTKKNNPFIQRFINAKRNRENSIIQVTENQVSLESPSKKKKDTIKKVKKSKRQKSKSAKKLLRSPIPNFEEQIRHQLEVYNELLPIVNGDQSPPAELDYDIGQACPPTPEARSSPTPQEEIDNNTLENFNDYNFDQ